MILMVLARRSTLGAEVQVWPMRTFAKKTEWNEHGQPKVQHEFTACAPERTVLV